MMRRFVTYITQQSKIKSSRKKKERQAVDMGENRVADRVLEGKLEGKKLLGKPRTK